MSSQLPKPSVHNLIMTSTVNETWNPLYLLQKIQKVWESQPDQDLEGGNDKSFFKMELENKNLFVVFDEAYSPETHATDHSKPATYTVMFTNEY